MPPHEKATVAVYKNANDNHYSGDAHACLRLHNGTTHIRKRKESQTNRQKENDVSNNDH